MVLEWLKELLGQKEKKISMKENPSLHTLGPEELLTDDEELIKGTPDAMLDANEMEEEPVSYTQEKEPIGKEDALKTMEAALFMGGKGMSVEELGRVAGLPLLKTREYLPELIDTVNARNSAIEIAENAGGYRMRIRSPYDEKVSHLAGVGELNAAEMKTLAFIAYKQPLLQSQLVQVRSNTAYEHLQKLVEMAFVSREPKGRSYVLRTTKKFTEYFGTNALKLKPIPKEDKNPIDHSASEELS